MIDIAGGHAGYTTRAGSTYVVRTEAMSGHEVLERTVVSAT